jgi:hypothetical protein
MTCAVGVQRLLAHRRLDGHDRFSSPPCGFRWLYCHHRAYLIEYLQVNYTIIVVGQLADRIDIQPRPPR